MNFEFLQDLIAVTIINFFIVFPATVGVLYLIDKVKEKRKKD
tara:strand:+ start:1437 stop:1562 length:126 start_codon:yes stop_codon:yes gene_type:complete